MTRFNKKAFSAAIAFIEPIAVNAMPVNLKTFDLSAYRYKGQFSAPFQGVRAGQLEHAERLMTRAGDVVVDEEQATPDRFLPKSNGIGNLDGPDGKLWYYTSNFVYDYVEVSESYKKPVMREFEYTIYDSNMELVGTIKDKVTYKEDETAIAASDILPVLTRNFFNDDDKYEVIISLTVNTLAFVNRNYSVAYSIGGEKKDGYDVPVMSIDMLVGDVLNASTPEKEEFYITFMEDDNEEVPEDWEPEPGDPDTMGYWKNLTSYGLRLEVYGKVDASGKLTKIWQKRCRLCDVAGDQQDSVFFMSLTHNGKPYFMFSHYEDSFFNPYYNFLEESTMRENNDLVVELYTLEGNELQLVQTTNIPTGLDTNVNKCIASYTAVGDLRYREDILFNDATGKADLIVTNKHYQAGNDDSSIKCYSIYSPEGVKKVSIFDYAESNISMTDLPGHEPQEMFVTTNVVGDYVFNFVDLYSGKTVLEQSYKFEIDPYSDPERVTSNIDRVASGDTYIYAGELRTPTQDEDGNDILRVIWFDKDGGFIRTDDINMGKHVHYAQCYIDNASLDPHLFAPDDYHEYMILVKRGYENDVKKEELVIGQAINPEYPDGRQLLLLTGDDEKGALANISLYLNTDTPMMMVGYRDSDYNVCMESYLLPLLAESSVGTVADGVAGDLVYDGSAVILAGHEIKVFGVNGALVASGNDRVSVRGLAPGIYVVYANGKGVRIAVK
ncbi:MAG: hypothetical protein K2J49_06365 [Muribaculaceae bacterium]|nr:hypothetical protein [Muribaculaceae bacterium]